MFLGTPQTTFTVYNKLRERSYKPFVWPARYPRKVAMYDGLLAPQLETDLNEEEDLAWKPTDTTMQQKFENVILGKPNFSFSITTDITNYTTIYSTNSLYKPVINNGVLVFLGNSVPTSTTIISMKEVYIYEGAFGTTTGMLISDISNVNISSPQDGQPLIYDNASQKWIAGTVGKDYIPISTLDTIDDVSLNGLTTGIISRSYSFAKSKSL